MQLHVQVRVAVCGEACAPRALPLERRSFLPTNFSGAVSRQQLAGSQHRLRALRGRDDGRRPWRDGRDADQLGAYDDGGLAFEIAMNYLQDCHLVVAAGSRRR